MLVCVFFFYDYTISTTLLAGKTDIAKFVAFFSSAELIQRNFCSIHSDNFSHTNFRCVWCVRVRFSACMHVCMRVCMYVWMCTRARVWCMFVCVCTYARVYVYMYVCVCAFFVLLMLCVCMLFYVQHCQPNSIPTFPGHIYSDQQFSITSILILHVMTDNASYVLLLMYADVHACWRTNVYNVRRYMMNVCMYVYACVCLWMLLSSAMC